MAMRRRPRRGEDAPVSGPPTLGGGHSTVNPGTAAELDGRVPTPRRMWSWINPAGLASRAGDLPAAHVRSARLFVLAS